MKGGGGGGMDSKKDDFGNNIKSLFTTHGIEVETNQQHGNGSRKMKYLTDVNRFSGGWLVAGAPSQASQLIPISAAAAAVAVALGKLKCSWQPTT